MYNSRLYINEIRSQNPDELVSKKKLLRNAVICIGWLKLVSVILYSLMYLLAQANSKGRIALAVQIMTLVIIPPQVFNGVLLFLGALEEKILALDISLWLCLVLACYNSVLGVIGSLYFIRSGQLTLQFILAVFYGLLLFSIVTVICHDVIVIYAYKTLLETERNPPNDININERAITWQDHT